MAYDITKLAKLGAIKNLAERVQTRLVALETSDAPIKAVSVTNNTLNFFTTTDTSTTAAFSFDLPAEQFLDAASTTLVPNFTFNAATYSGAVDPNLNGKPVLVLGVKTKNNNESTTTTAYSFLDMSNLVDIYTASDTSVTISDYKAKVNISTVADNAITLNNDGLHVDISGKVDKVTTAVSGNVAGFGTSGAVTDTGIASADVLTKITSATENHLTAFDASGGIKDSSYAVATDDEVTEMLDSILGAAS